MAVTWKKLAYETDVITKVLLTTKGDMIYASAASTPARLGIGSDNYVMMVATDVPNWETMPAPVAHTLNGHTAATGAVDFNGQMATDLVVDTVVNEAALPITDIAVGELKFATGELTFHICTAIV